MATILYRKYKGEIETVRIRPEHVKASLQAGYVTDPALLQDSPAMSEPQPVTSEPQPVTSEPDPVEGTPNAVQEQTETQPTAEKQWEKPKKRGRPKKSETA